MSHCHSHEHGHEHDHEHDHGHGHAGDEVHALLDGALALSQSWEHTCRVPVPAADLEARVTDGLCQVASLLAEDGTVLGHIKAFLQSGEDGVALSITRADTVDRTVVGTWPPQCPVGGWTLTVNVLSLVHTGAITPELLERLFAP